MPRSLADGLPGTTAELLVLLNEVVKSPPLTPERLADEQGRLEMMREVGRRDLVNSLLAIWHKQKE